MTEHRQDGWTSEETAEAYRAISSNDLAAFGRIRDGKSRSGYLGDGMAAGENINDAYPLMLAALERLGANTDKVDWLQLLTQIYAT